MSPSLLAFEAISVTSARSQWFRCRVFASSDVTRILVLILQQLSGCPSADWWSMDHEKDV